VDVRYESAVKDYALALLDNEGLRSEFSAFVDRLALAGWRNSLAQTMVKLLAPGIPDIYQGSELADFSLVDPDNRRPVDFAQCARLLAEGGRPAGFPAAKQALVAQLLAVRNAHPDLFAQGDYFRLESEGPKREHLVGFGRSHRGRLLIAVAPRLTLGLIDERGEIPAEAWRGTKLLLRPEWQGMQLRDASSPRRIEARAELDVSELLSDSYVGVFVAEHA
jgi:(1->4)-alpha-D-glucan 1-alpha-D-glucosylmutase